MSSETILPKFPPAWRAVALGMKCLTVGALLLFVGMVFVPVFAVVQYHLLGERYTAEELRGRNIPLGPMLIASYLLLMGLLAWLAGLCLCALAPVESGVRTFAMAGIACWVLFVIVVSQTSFLTGIGFASIYSRETIERREPPVRIVAVNEIGFGTAATFLAIAAGVLTSCSLGAVAHHYRNVSIAQSIQRFIVYQIGALALLVFLGFLYLYLAAIWTRAGFWLSGPCAFAALVDVAIGCSWLLRILKKVRTMLAIAEENAKPLDVN